MSDVVDLLEIDRVPVRRSRRKGIRGAVEDQMDLERELKCSSVDLSNDAGAPQPISCSGNIIYRCRSWNGGGLGGAVTDVAFLNSVAKGSSRDRLNGGGDRRIGDEVQEVRLDIQLFVFQPNHWTAWDNAYNMYRGASVRVIVVRENHGKSGVLPSTGADMVARCPSIDDILTIPPYFNTTQGGEYSRYHATPNWENRKRFTFLYDKIHPLTPRYTAMATSSSNGGGGATTVSFTNPSQTDVFIPISLKLDRRLKFQTGPLDAQFLRGSNLDENSIFLYGISSAPVFYGGIDPVPQSYYNLLVRGTSRLFYEDA